MSQPLLIEIGCEDLPARYVQALAAAFAEGLAAGLAQRGVSHGEVRRYATPRRIAALIESVASEQPEQLIERRGPAVAAAFRDGQPTPAATGFARSCGVEVDALERIRTDKGEWLAYRETRPGAQTTALLAEIFAETLQRMDQLVPKRMRWGSGDATFVRPVRWLLCLYGADSVPLEAFGHTAGRHSHGHRFHAPQPIELATAEAYEAALENAHVIADFGRRREAIRAQLLAAADALGGSARIDEGLLDEVTALVELPRAISGRFDARFLELPPAVIIVTVEEHQRYFPVYGADGGLLPAFITVSNIESRDEAQVVAGNERVVRPRLEDAMFFWTQDLNKGLESRLPDLDKVTFQAKLGSVGDKSHRIAELAASLAGQLGEDVERARRAGALCKADLVSQMVYEFPELQGVMGGHYARLGGEAEDVATAIAEHYQPAGAGDAVPASALGRIVALADKLDTLAGIFAAGLKPSGKKDPFALRRAAIGVLRILREGGLPLKLSELVRAAVRAQPIESEDALADELDVFLADRLQALLRDEGYAVELCRAVAGVRPATVPDFFARLTALAEFRKRPEAEALAEAHKRARNILRQAGDEPVGTVAATLFEDTAEQTLATALEQAGTDVETATAGARYGAALDALAGLRDPVEAFFEAVMVMAEDAAVRRNRLALLARLDTLCGRIADLSELPA